MTTETDPLRAELSAALTARAATIAAERPCPQCSHRIADHTARVGDTGHVCAWCDCYRYCTGG